MVTGKSVKQKREAAGLSGHALSLPDADQVPVEFILAKQRDGRRGLVEPRLTRVNVVCSTEMLDWLDSVSSTMYRKTGVGGSRSEVLRGLCEGFADRKPQFTGCHSGADIRRVIGKLFNAYAQARATSPTPRPPQNTVARAVEAVKASPLAKPAADSDSDFQEAVRRTRPDPISEEYLAEKAAKKARKQDEQ